MNNFSRFVLVNLLFLCSCSNNSQDPITTDSLANSSTGKKDTASDWRTLTEGWTASLDLKNASIMKSFYGDTVLYYGDKISGEDVVKRQKAYFDEHPDYKMKLEEYIGEEQQPDGNWKIRITKAVTTNGKTANYPASLIYAKRNGIWKIINESDDITDLRKGHAVEVKYEPEVVSFEGLLEENTGFGTNTSGGDPKSDNKEMYKVVWLSQPINVIGSGKNAEEKNVERVQLLGDDKMITAFLNKKVMITGTLSHGSEKQFTKVVLTVTKIEAIK